MQVDPRNETTVWNFRCWIVFINLYSTVVQQYIFSFFPLQSVENTALAMCTVCSRVSKGLNVCDSCGSPLSEYNTSFCYSVEPKCSRKDTAATADTSSGGANTDSANKGSETPLTNGQSSAADNSSNNSTATSTDPVVIDNDSSDISEAKMNCTDPPRPVPQALYLNKNTAAQLPPGTMPGNAIPVMSSDPFPQSFFKDCNSLTSAASALKWNDRWSWGRLEVHLGSGAVPGCSD